MHRVHHGHTDKPKDPHSPHNDPDPFLMIWTIRNNYFNLYIGRTDIAEKSKLQKHYYLFCDLTL